MQTLVPKALKCLSLHLMELCTIVNSDSLMELHRHGVLPAPAALVVLCLVLQHVVHVFECCGAGGVRLGAVGGRNLGRRVTPAGPWHICDQFSVNFLAGGGFGAVRGSEHFDILRNM